MTLTILKTSKQKLDFWLAKGLINSGVPHFILSTTPNSMATRTPIRQSTTIHILDFSATLFLTIACSEVQQHWLNLHRTLSCSLSLIRSCFSHAHSSFSHSSASFTSSSSFFSARSAIMSTMLRSDFSMNWSTISQSVSITC